MLRLFFYKLIFLAIFSLNLNADRIPEIHSFIDKNAQYFLTIIKTEGSEYEADPEKFKNKLKNIWEPMVDVRLVSRLILSKAYSAASEDQVLRFQERTKKLLLDTYVTTLLEFKDYDLSTDQEIKVNKNKTFEVNVRFSSNTSYSFSTKFTVYKNNAGEYKIVNIIIDGINLGLTFRNQFQGVLKKSNFDLDEAINSWQPLSSEELFST